MANIAECMYVLTLNDDGSYEEFNEGDLVNLELDKELSVSGEIISVDSFSVTLSEDDTEIEVQFKDITGWF